jgi:ABC-type branched-subunit amino acid transport system ATPase component/ABC-type branched-subunit amino acid transport system permease subunit
VSTAAVLAVTVTADSLFGGLVDGLSIGLLALGIVLIYRSNGVINFAVGAVGSFAVALLALLVLRYGWPYWLALLAAILAGASMSAVAELTVVTRLFRAPRVILLVATVGLAQLGLAAQLALPDSGARANTPFPTPFSGTWTVRGVRFDDADLLVLAIVPLLAITLTVFLTRTDVGKAVRAAAANPDRARLSAINPKLLSTLVWAIAGVLSVVSLVLLAGTAGSAAGLQTLGPSTLSRVLAAALLANMTSFPKAMVAGVAIGVVQAVVVYNAPTQAGAVDALLFLVVLASTWLLARRDDGADDAAFSFAPRSQPLPPRVAATPWARRLPYAVGALAAVAAVALPFVITQPSRHLLFARMLVLALVALSLVVLTGWGGQISLGQGAFAGLGAFGYAALVNGNRIGLGIGPWSTDALLPAFTPASATAIVTLTCAAAAALMGAGALKARGLLLAVVTFVFAVAAQQFLWQRPFLSDGRSTVFVERALVGSIDLRDQRSYYLLALLALAATMGLLSRLRRSGIGRSIVAVRSNPEGAAACTVAPARTKLLAFALSGAIAGFGGALLGGLLSTISTSEVFTVDASVQIVSIAVIGGVGSVIGPVLGSLWVVGLPAMWSDSTLVPLITSSIGLLVLLMYVPGGLVQIGLGARDGFYRWLEPRLPERPPPVRPVELPSARARSTTPADAGPALEVHDLTVNFGNRTAVDHVDLRIDRGEVVGLIGTNGAGKSTLMNAISGFVHATGSVELLGENVTRRSAHRRASAGLGRTFQTARLFADLTVRETLQVALEARHRTGTASTMLLLPGGFRTERRQRADTDEIVAFLGLGRYAGRYCSELSTGTRRIVELGVLLALDAKVLCLDEPTAGVAQRETEAFGPLLLRIREELDASLLVIEHDMPLIMSISDRVCCLETGRVIASGRPDAVRHDPAVIASYLGTDRRAIERSGSGPANQQETL